MKLAKKITKNFLLKSGYELNRKIIKNDHSLYMKYFSEDSIKNKRFYNIGAGGFSHPFWTNIDYQSDWYSQNRDNTKRAIQYDLHSFKPIPIDVNSAEIFYTSHTIEHITEKASQFIFDEVYKILKKGGIFRLTTPDIELGYRAFKENDLDFFLLMNRNSADPAILNGVEVIKDKRKASIEQLFLYMFASSVSTLHNFGDKKFTDEEIRRIFSEKDLKSALDYFTSFCSVELQKKFVGDHINWWNKEKIFNMLEKAGFTKIFLSGYGQSFSPVLRNTYYFDNTHPEISIYVEAFK